MKDINARLLAAAFYVVAVGGLATTAIAVRLNEAGEKREEVRKENKALASLDTNPKTKDIELAPE